MAVREYIYNMFCDSHNDILTSILKADEIGMYLTDLGFHSDLSALTLALWTTESTKDPLPNLTALIESFYGYSSDIRIGFAVEDAGFVDKNNVDSLCALPLNYITLTWNHNNNIAGGAHGDGRLTAWGKNFILKCNERDILIDTAHLNKKSFWDVAKFSDSILINSHTCADAVCKNRRNIEDGQIKNIFERGGYIGIAFVGDFLNGGNNASSSDVVRHIDYIAQKFGVDSLGLGTDFFGTANYPTDLKDYKSLGIIVEKLFDLGYNKEAVDKITHKNYIKTFYDRRKVKI